jgi:hypothetical protein
MGDPATVSNELVRCFFVQNIDPFLFSEGFLKKVEKDGIFFWRSVGPAQQSVGFAYRKRPEGGHWIFCGVGVRYPDVEELLALGDPIKLARETGTVGSGIHLLHASPYPYYEFLLDDSTDPHSLAQTIIGRIKDYGMPFIRKFTDKNVLREALASGSKEIHNLDPRGRIMVLAAINFTQGNRREAIRILEEALADRDNQLPKHQMRLGELLEYLKEKMSGAKA